MENIDEKVGNYQMPVGEEDSLRLTLLNEIYNPCTQNFLLSAGLKQCQNILVVGCGNGIMTSFIANQIKKTSKVIGVDTSKEQINLARINNKIHSNATFEECSIYELEKLNQSFDVTTHPF